MDKEQISTMLDKIVSGDNSAAQDDFNNIISQKVSDAIELKKVEVAQSIYSDDQGEEDVDAESV